MRTPTKEHGTYGKYRQGCHCPLCKAAKSRYSKALRIDHERGIHRRCDPTAAREHVLDLMTHGVTYTLIARAAGLPHARVGELVNGKKGRPLKWIFRPTEEKLLAVTLDDIQPEHGFGKVSPEVGYRRRVEALGYMGWSMSRISEAMGFTKSTVHTHLNIGAKVRTTSVQKLDEVYRQLRDTPGPVGRARWCSYYAGYAPPMAWDDETIDDPNAKPAEVCCVVKDCVRAVRFHNLCSAHYNAVRERGGLQSVREYHREVDRLGARRRQDGDRTRREVAELEEFGFSPSTIAKRLGIDEDYLHKLRTRRAA